MKISQSKLQSAYVEKELQIMELHMGEHEIFFIYNFLRNNSLFETL